MGNKFLPIILFVFCFQGCSKDVGVPSYCYFTNEIAREFNKDMREKYGLLADGYGWSFTWSVQRVIISYEYPFKNASHIPSRDEMREIYYDCVQDFVNRMNAADYLHPFFHNIPFTEGNIKLSFGIIIGPNEDWPPYGEIAHVFNGRDSLCFSTYNHETERLEDLYREPYGLQYRGMRTEEIEALALGRGGDDA